MYADKITASMRAAMDETARRRALQTAWNVEHDITPTTIHKNLDTSFAALYEEGEGSGRGKRGRKGSGGVVAAKPEPLLSSEDVGKKIVQLEKEMRDAARELEFERAAALRDRIRALREALVSFPE